MAQYTINQTKSISPISYNEIDAKVIRENDKVYLVKQDEQGKMYKNLIEKKYEFYHLMTKERVNKQVPPIVVQVSISSACNLNCPICYELKDGVEPSLKEIESLLRNFRNKAIVFCGREPTCREDLFQIIKISNKRNYACLLTNGLKLSEYEYVLKLKNSGLKRIVFSFNGFKDEIYQLMNGRPLLDLKLQALENVRKIGINTVISTTMARGINEDQIRKLCNFCLDNRSFILELRIRSISPVGKHLTIEPYCMSELLDLVADALEIKREDILKEYILVQEYLKSFKFIIPYYRIQNHFRYYFHSRLCSFSFHIKKGKKFYPLGKKIEMEKIKKSKFKLFLLTYYLIKIYGLRYIFEKLLYNYKFPGILKNKKILMIVLRCWPNVYNIDLEENKKCTSLYYKNGKMYPFCYYNIIECRRCS